MAKETSNKDSLMLPIIVIGVVAVGLVTLFLMQWYSLNNKYICKYLGGLWERKTIDTAHRCYTYEEFYNGSK
jgi:hypothetical protein